MDRQAIGQTGRQTDRPTHCNNYIVDEYFKFSFFYFILKTGAISSLNAKHNNFCADEKSHTDEKITE